MRLRTKQDRRAAAHTSDAALLAQVRNGEDEAFGELYERHLGAARGAARALVASHAEADDVVAEAFTRVLSIVQRGGGPDEAFRPYVLTCVRHASFDRTKHVARATPVDPEDLADLVNERYQDQPDNTLTDADLMAQAFATLPERWQLVLWSTEVDGRRPGDLASELDMAPAAVASLAYRARQGLAEAYLAAHLRRRSAPSCAATRSRLAVFVRGNVGEREAITIAKHLDQCDECRALVDDLRDVNRPLRGVLVPAIVGVPAAGYFTGGASIAGILGGIAPRLAQLIENRPVFAGAGAIGLAVAVGATLGGLAPAAPALPNPPTTSTIAATAMAHPATSNGTVAPDAPITASAPPGPADATAAATVASPAGSAGPGADAPTAATDGAPVSTSPPVTMPGITLPSVRAVTLPSVPLNTLPSPPPITVPAVVLPAAPSVSLPVVTVPAISVPPITVPPMTVPTLPPVTVPTLPAITVPTLGSATTTAPA